MSEQEARTDRILGMGMGAAIGDALGAAVEFLPPGSFPPVTGYRGGGPHPIGPGMWTDDTSMSLALAESLLECGMDPDDQMRRYLEWYRHGMYSPIGRCFDIGQQTRQALLRFEEVPDFRLSGAVSDHASGNGGIMRLAPVAAWTANLWPTRKNQIMMACRLSSRTTHANELCKASAAFLGLLLTALLNGVSKWEVLSPDWGLRQGTERERGLFSVMRGEYQEKVESEIKPSGFVVDTLEAALFCFYQESDFEACVLRAANLGGDADTIACVAGMIAGACWGEQAIPAHLRHELYYGGEIREYYELLAEKAEKQS